MRKQRLLPRFAGDWSEKRGKGTKSPIFATDSPVQDSAVLYRIIEGRFSLPEDLKSIPESFFTLREGKKTSRESSTGFAKAKKPFAKAGIIHAKAEKPFAKAKKPHAHPPEASRRQKNLIRILQTLHEGRRGLPEG